MGSASPWLSEESGQAQVGGKRALPEVGSPSIPSLFSAAGKYLGYVPAVPCSLFFPVLSGRAWLVLPLNLGMTNPSHQPAVELGGTGPTCT